MMDMNEQRKKVVIVGGGITGFPQRFICKKKRVKKGFHSMCCSLKRRIVLVEKSRRFDVTVLSLSVVRIHFLIRKKSIGILAEDLGIEDELVKNATGQAYILVNGKLHPIPGGSVMGIPTEIGPFLKIRIVFIGGKTSCSGGFRSSRVQM